jgi:GT2 family glycosyltransferase
MDDFPASPTGPGPRRPALAVVIPVRNGGRDFERCLRGLRASSWSDFELVVVDDGSADDSAATAAAFGAVVVRHERPRGPAAARNAGAQAATAPLVFFLDADVVLHPDALERAVARFAAEPDLAALFGSYDDRPAAPGLVSRFRNLLHHYIHQQGDFRCGARAARTFWTGCGAIRRDVFLALGGFDPRRYRRPAIEDIELGYRLGRAGHRIELVRDIQATHLKRWTLRQVVRTDILNRGVPWALLMLRSRVAETDLNVSRSQQICVAATGLGLLGLAASPWAPALLAVPLAGLATIVALNRGFYRFLARRQGVRFAIASVPLHLVYYGCCGLSVVIALVVWHLQGRGPAPASSPPPAARRRVVRAKSGGRRTEDARRTKDEGRRT